MKTTCNACSKKSNYVADGICLDCERRIESGETVEQIQADATKRIARNAKAKNRRRIMDDVADSLGLVKVRGSVSGRIYYE